MSEFIAGADGFFAGRRAGLREIEQLRLALRTLVDSLDECTPHIDSAFHFTFAARGGTYTGPSYGTALKIAKVVLDA